MDLCDEECRGCSAWVCGECEGVDPVIMPAETWTCRDCGAGRYGHDTACSEQSMYCCRECGEEIYKELDEEEMEDMEDICEECQHKLNADAQETAEAKDKEARDAVAAAMKAAAKAAAVKSTMAFLELFAEAEAAAVAGDFMKSLERFRSLWVSSKL